FKKKDYAKAEERFETLYKRTPGGDKNQAAELIKFKIYMTLLLQGKESRAHSMMEEFQFTGDTPALYYAQAAWEYKHNNAEKAADWTGSANKIYSPALNSVFADAFYDVGWMQGPEGSTAPAVAFDTSNEQNNQPASVQTSPSGNSAVEAAPAKVWSLSGGRRMWIVAGLLLAALLLLASVIVPVVRKHALNVPRHLRLEPPSDAAAAPAAVLKPRVAPAQTSSVHGNGFVGGPRQVSVQLKPWKASFRQTVLSPVRSSTALNRLKEQRANTSPAPARPEPDREFAPIAENDFESSDVGPVLEQTADTLQPAAPSEAAETI